MNHNDYHSHKALSRSFLWSVYNQSLAHALAEREVHKVTKALRFGSAIHCGIIEPHKFSAEWKITHRNTGLPEGMISEEEHEQICGMREAIEEHSIASELLEDGVAEQSFFTQLESQDIKIRPDWKRNDGIIVDLKSTEDCSPDEFSRSAWKCGYHFQAAFYLDALRALGEPAETFIFIAIEKKPPYAIQVYEIDDDFLEIGKYQYISAIKKYQEAVKSGIFGYKEEVKLLKAPGWAKVKHLREI